MSGRVERRSGNQRRSITRGGRRQGDPHETIGQQWSAVQRPTDPPPIPNPEPLPPPEPLPEPKPEPPPTNPVPEPLPT
jgi:hypothetical protein